jgi:hypothetical protein
LDRLAVPTAIEPSKKVTVPVTVPDPFVGVTVAVRVTVCPKLEEVGVTKRKVVVGVTAPEPVTTCITKLEAAPL